MCGRLRVGKSFLHVCSIGRCSHVFGLLDAVHMTAGHNALRGSGPGQKPAFDNNAMAQVGCPDRRIDRLCITCCSPSQPSHHAEYPARSRPRIPRLQSTRGNEIAAALVTCRDVLEASKSEIETLPLV